MEGPWCRFRRKREPVSDIDTAVVDSLKVIDPVRPIGEAVMACATQSVSAWLDVGRLPAMS